MSDKRRKIVVFSDLDGSLLNKKYRYDEIEPTISRLSALNVPIVLASSKTKSEIVFYRKKMQINDPFIVENGSAIFIPKAYFQTQYSFSKQKQGYRIVELGIPYRTIRRKLAAVKAQTGAEMVGFGDMTVEAIAEDSGLPLNLARLAKKREYSEPFKVLRGSEKQVLQAISNQGLHCVSGGRYLNSSGNTDKGKAVSILKDLFLRQFGEILSVGVGDSANDLTMLKTVDKPFFVNNESEKKDVWMEIQRLAEAAG